MIKVCGICAALISVLIYYYGDAVRSLFPRTDRSLESDRLFTANELSKYNGDSSPLFLSILGEVYDVTEGSKHYAPGSNYNIFVGRDASKSFVTGEFSDTSKDLDDVLELSADDLIGLENWTQMYRKQYTYKGKLIGRFYDTEGEETDYLTRVKLKIEEGKNDKLIKDQTNRKYPPCNAEWDASSGSRVWCSERSGGIERDWKGVPRLMHVPGSDEPYCICANPDDTHSINNPNLKAYSECDLLSSSCVVNE